jgi:hypothetical protein
VVHFKKFCMRKTTEHFIIVGLRDLRNVIYEVKSLGLKIVSDLLEHFCLIYIVNVAHNIQRMLAYNIVYDIFFWIVMTQHGG